MVVFMTVTVTPISFKPNQKSPFKWSGRPLDPAMVRANSFGLPYREPQPVDAPGELLPKFSKSYKLNGVSMTQTTCAKHAKYSWATACTTAPLMPC